jgi:hypothetical protein
MRTVGIGLEVFDYFGKMARPKRFELLTPRFVVCAERNSNPI